MPASDWDFLRERVVMVSTYPPARDGIARYADQLARRLAADRIMTLVGFAERDCGGDIRLRLTAWPYLLRTARLAPGADVLIHWHSHYFTGGTYVRRIGQLLATNMLLRARPCVVLMHEPDGELSTGSRGARRLAYAVEECLRRWTWSLPARYVFHSRSEAERFCARNRRGRRREVHIVTHGGAFQPAATMGKTEARAHLCLPQDKRVFLCIGFISENKAFDRAVRAFGRAAPRDAVLYVVGTPIGQASQHLAQVEGVKALAAATPGATFCEVYVSNEVFDAWIIAADAVIVPYRVAASSSVIPRCQLLGTPVISSGVGGTAEQLTPPDKVFASDADLVALLVGFGRDGQPA